MIFGSDRSSRKANLRSFVRPFVPSLSEALNLHLLGSYSRQEHSESIKQKFREPSDFIIPSEPNILRLVP